jgi:hypothetical protein
MRRPDRRAGLWIDNARESAAATWLPCLAALDPLKPDQGPGAVAAGPWRARTGLRTWARSEPAGCCQASDKADPGPAVGLAGPGRASTGEPKRAT